MVSRFDLGGGKSPPGWGISAKLIEAGVDGVDALEVLIGDLPGIGRGRAIVKRSAGEGRAIDVSSICTTSPSRIRAGVIVSPDDLFEERLLVSSPSLESPSLSDSYEISRSGGGGRRRVGMTGEGGEGSERADEKEDRSVMGDNGRSDILASFHWRLESEVRDGERKAKTSW